MERKYAAFISYRHLPLDAAVAERLHRLIERYRIPKDLRKNGQKHLGLVFRDRDELPLSNDLTQDIYDALDNSEYLIVICTPDTPKSLWVQREIQHFISVHGRNKVLTVLAAGSMEESVPECVTTVYADDGVTVLDRIEPLCAFLVDENKNKVLRNLRSEFLRLAAAILGCPYDSLKQRQKRYRAQQAMIGFGAVAAIALVIIGMLVNWNLEVTAKNEEISGLNTQIQEQLRQTQLNESKALTLLSQSQLAEGDRLGAVESALSALKGDRPYYAPAEAALASAMHIYGGEKYYQFASLQLYADVHTIIMSDDDHYAVAVDENGNGTCIDLLSGDILWSDLYLRAFNGHSRITADNERLITLGTSGGVIYDLKTGAEQKRISYGNAHDFTVLSPDDRFLVVGDMEWFGSAMDIAIIDLSAGEEVHRISLEKSYRYSSFSTDGRYLVLIPLEDSKDSGEETILIDCMAGTAVQVPIPGTSISTAAIPAGGFVSLNVEGAWDETGKYTYHVFSADGQVIHSSPADSTDAAQVELLLATDQCLFAIEKGGIGLQLMHWDDRIKYDGKSSLSVMLATPDVWNTSGEVRVPVASIQDDGGLLVVDEVQGIYKLSVSAAHEREESDGDVSSSEAKKQYQYRESDDLYGESLAFQDAFINVSSGNVIALVEDEDASKISFLRMSGFEPENISDRVPGGYTKENAQQYIEKLIAEPGVGYRKFDKETGTLYWGKTKDTAKATVCPYPNAKNIAACGSGLVVLPTGELSTDPDGFAVFSTEDEQWKWVDYPDEWMGFNSVMVADTKKQVIVLSKYESMLYVFDFETGEICYSGQFPVGRIIGDHKFICEERFWLLSESFEPVAILVDTDTWQILGEYNTALTDFSFSAELATAAISPDGKRLYIGNRMGYQQGLVIDLETGTLLAKVPYMACYDPETDSLLCLDPERQALSAWPAYDTEDLITMGSDLLAGNR